MRNRSLVLMFIAIIAIISGGCSQQKNDLTEGITSAVSSTELEWLLEGDYANTTEQHMSNLAENYQILEDHILYLDTIEYSAGQSDVFSILYKVDKSSGKKTKLFENIDFFIEQNGLLYFSKVYEDSYIGVGVYNMSTEETNTILSKKANVGQVLSIEEQSILYLDQEDRIIECKIDGSQKKVCMKFSTLSSPFIVVKSENTLFFSEQGNAQMVMLDDKKADTYMQAKGLSDNILVCNKDKAYYVVDTYKIGSWYNRISLESELNGLWEIDMTKHTKRKISDITPKKLYLRNGEIYDDKFVKIVNG